jgi:recombination protein RecT
MNEILKEKLAEKAEMTAPDKKKEVAKDPISNLMTQMRKQVEMALPRQINADRMCRVFMSIIRVDEKLSAAVVKNPASLLAAIMQSSQLGLEPNTPLGEAYFIAYNNNRTNLPEVQFQIGYKGLLQLAYRTGEYKRITAMEVYTNDEFDYAYGLDTYLKHKPAMTPTGEPVFYYALYELHNGGRDFKVWSTEKIKDHAKKYSQSVKAGRKSPWDTDFDAMAKKTVLKDVLKYAPKSIELDRQLSMDETIKHHTECDMSEVPDLKYAIVD